MSDLYRLVYTSRNHVSGGEDEQSATVSGILAVSKRNNARVGVTGALLFNAGSFAQVLEGPRAGVEATFERIQRDPRHSDVSVLQCEPVTARGFPNWSMAFVGRSPRGRALWDEVARRTDFDITRIEGDRLFATLLAIVEEEEGAAIEVLNRSEPISQGLDVERLRTELRPQISDRFVDSEVTSTVIPSQPIAAPSVKSVTNASGPAPSAVDILRVALEDERARTSALRGELDEVRIDLAAARHAIEKVERHRDIWAERAKAMAAAMIREPGVGTQEREVLLQRDRMAVVR